MLAKRDIYVRQGRSPGESGIVILFPKMVIIIFLLELLLICVFFPFQWLPIRGVAASIPRGHWAACWLRAGSGPAPERHAAHGGTGSAATPLWQHSREVSQSSLLTHLLCPESFIFRQILQVCRLRRFLRGMRSALFTWLSYEHDCGNNGNI